MDTPNTDKILLNLIKTLEFESPEWNEASEAADEISRLKRHLEAVKEAKEATDNALYHMQFVRLEEVIEYCLQLKDYIRSNGLEIPEPCEGT